MEELRLEIVKPAFAPVDIANHVPVPAGLLHDGSGPRLPLPLRKLALTYRGGAFLDFGGGGVDPSEWLPALQKVKAVFVALAARPALYVIGGTGASCKWALSVAQTHHLTYCAACCR